MSKSIRKSANTFLAISVTSLAFATLMVACADEALRPVTKHLSDGGVAASPEGAAATPEAGVDASVAEQTLACPPARSSENIPARTVVTSNESRARDSVVYVSQLGQLFQNSCGGCHGNTTAQGNFNVKDARAYASADLDKVLARVTSDDPALVMPPRSVGGGPASQRRPGDPVTQLAEWTRLYIAQRKPIDTFIIPAAQAAPSNSSPYVLNVASGRDLTNIGSCVPVPAIVGIATDKMTELDALFAGLKKTPGQGTNAERIGLPLTLDQTDLFTMDTEDLARHGVIGYAPGYPLWSDGARKLRQIRVPVGKSIAFDADKQTFEIPDNTRFYKTFLKQVRQLDGTLRWRKVETRLIVSRPDVELGAGKRRSDAIFGSYKWDADEKVATLSAVPQRNGEPFADDLFTVVVDEIKEEEVKAEHPKFEEAALLSAQARRHYAIPSVDRCVQCHMGSPTNNFVLGFLPLQINRLPIGEEGVIEPSGPDELNQLQRLIDYGIVTGLDSADEVVRLSDSQGKRGGDHRGDRKPRNDYELQAQGYMFGNCAHCHNPRGFTTVNNPVLDGVLDFLPSENGGIFQFSLEKTSPRIFKAASRPIAYITPSLFDDLTTTILKGTAIGSGSTIEAASVAQDASLAPWRSLIYRNVDTPFTYTDAATLYPHMPMNVPGFDCRAPRVIGDWMVSIPAKRKALLREDLVCAPQTECVPYFDNSVQPYAEVLPGQDGYAVASKSAQARLWDYHEGTTNHQVIELAAKARKPSRYNQCPVTDDIIDPSLTGGLGARTPADSDPMDQYLSLTKSVNVGVPGHPHWFPTDITDEPPPWAPRNTQWSKVLGLPHQFPDDPGAAQKEAQASWATSKQAAEMLVPSTGAPPLNLTYAMMAFSRTPVAMGLWNEKASHCPADANVQTVDQLPAEQTRRWRKNISSMDKDGIPVAAKDHVYAELPGQAVYSMICINCHGANFDSRGRLADNLMNVTGGLARVANFRGGLFGQAGSVRKPVFEEAAPKLSPRSAPDAWAARYVAWMGLGGTQAGIPGSLLALVANTPVMGLQRAGTYQSTSANMLESARDLCRDAIADKGFVGDSKVFDPQDGWLGEPFESRLIRQNGDAELWLRMCAIDNAAPIREVGIFSAERPNVVVLKKNLYSPRAYGSNAVADFYGRRQAAVTPDNLLPWCMEDTPLARTYVATQPDRAWMPFCPKGLTPLTDEERDAWALRGAINAGFAVFVYLDAVSKGASPQSDYDHCELAAKRP
jgi:mono/diheme cytochrome c family protein